MIPLLLFVPLAVSGGGLLGLVHEHMRHKCQTERLSTKVSPDASPGGDMEADEQATATPSRDLIQIKHSECSAHLALGVSAVGILYPPVGLISLPTLGYSAYDWLRARYPFEEPRLKSPSTIVPAVAMLGFLATGHWLMASLVLSADLATRKWISNWTLGYQWIGEPGSHATKWFTTAMHPQFLQQRKNLTQTVSEDEPRWEKSQAPLVPVSLGQLFAVSDWHTLLTAAHWKRLMVSIGDTINTLWKNLRP